MKVVREEIFGPVVCAQPITDEDLEAIAREANNTTYGLAASVWSRDISKANKLAKRLRAGTVWMNCHNAFDASLPCGGYKESGDGTRDGRVRPEQLYGSQGRHHRALIDSGCAGSVARHCRTQSSTSAVRNPCDDLSMSVVDEARGPIDRDRSAAQGRGPSSQPLWRSRHLW